VFDGTLITHVPRVFCGSTTIIQGLAI